MLVFFRFQITFVKDVGWIWFKLKRKSNPPIEQHSARASRHHAAVVKSIPDEGSAMDRYPIRTLYKNIIQTNNFYCQGYLVDCYHGDILVMV